LGSFQDLLAGTGNPPALGAEPAPPAWTGFRPLLVTRVTAESDAVASINLEAPDRDPLPRAAAGQYLTLRVPGAGEPAPVRSYSLSGDPAQPGYRISVKRESHGRVSSYLHRTLHPGVAVEVAAPRGDFVLGGASRPSLLISAGVGITPVLAMLHQLVDERTTSPVWWLHTTRGPATHTFAAEVTDLLAALPDVRSRVYYTAANPTSALPPGVYPGRLTQEVIATLGIPRNAVAYLCGPATFMDDVAAALQAVGLDAASIRSERFAARAAINPGVVQGSARQPHQPDGDVGTGPAVTFARSDLTTAWSGRYASLLELAEACDVPTRWSCRTGVCHTCITAVLSGATAYNTAPLEVPPPEDVLVCSARPITDLVLDL
jgi:ferredoxin-NADP reductase/ferredoxin